jgi:hypothetical protein
MKLERTYRFEGLPWIREEHTNREGRWHWEGGPALSGPGMNAWWVDGKLHRVDGPAIEEEDYKAWWLGGVCQRVEFPNGRVYTKPSEVASESHLQEEGSPLSTECSVSPS